VRELREGFAAAERMTEEELDAALAAYRVTD
jgi:hypothetical protein